MKLVIAALPCLALGWASAAAAADDDYVQMGLGADYSSGEYGTAETTDMLALPLSFKLKTGALTLRASLPFVAVTGPAGVIPGDGGTGGGNGGGNGGGGNGGPGTGSERISRSGLGDLALAATYSLDLAEDTWLDLTGKAKLPTASRAEALGTGTTDFTVEAEVLHSFGDLSAALSGGRRFNGSNADYPLRDVWQAGAGVYYELGDTQLGLDYDWRDASLEGAANRSEVTGSVTHKMSDALRLQGYAYTGLADGSPDLGAGAQVLYRFGL